MRNLDDLCATVPALQNARVLQQLANGPVADKWQLGDGERSYSVRVDRPVARRIGLDRYAERQALEALAASGCCEAPIFADPAAGVLVLSWVEGRPWQHADFHDAERLRELAGLLHALHTSAAQLPPLQLGRRNRLYAEVARSGRVRRHAAEVEALLADARGEPAAACPCHNDPVAGNVLTGQEPRLIDFEYAAAGNAHFDLAAVIEHHRLDNRARDALLHAYAEEGGAPNRAMLSVWRRIYRLTAANWSAAMSVSGR